MAVKDENKLVRNHSIQYNNLSKTERFLEKMAAEGWMLEAISGRVKTVFKKCEPTKLRFSVNVFSEGSEYDTHLLEKNMEYIEYCESVGWKFICAAGCVHVFCSADENTPVIDTDPAMELKTIHKLMWPQKLLIGSLMSVMAIIQIVTSLTWQLNITEQNSLSFSNLILWSIVLVIWILQAINYSSWYIKAKRAAKNGEKLPEGKPVNCAATRIALAVFACIDCGVMCWAGIVFHDYMNFIVIPIWVLMFIFLLVFSKVMEASEKNRIGRVGLKLITFLVAPAILCYLMFGMIFGVVFFSNSENRSCNIITDTSAFTYDGAKLSDYEQLIDDYGRFLINNYDYTLTGKYADGREISWDFCVWETKVPAIHQRLLKEAKEDAPRRAGGITFRLGLAELFDEFDTGTVSVYANQCDDGYEYLLYDEDTIVTLSTQTVLTKEQFDIIREDIMKRLYD